MKTILVILDGAAGLPNKILKNQTALEAADTPNLDYLASHGRTGLIYPVNPTVAPESDVAVTALLGYDPYKYFTGRGPLEAIGAGIELKGNFLALRANFATIQDEDEIIERRAGRTLTTPEAKELEKAINKEVKLPCKFIFKSTIEHRGVLVLKGKFSSEITNVDPAYKRIGAFGVAYDNKNPHIQRCMPLKPEARIAAAIINEFIENTKEVLKNHPLNKRRKQKNLLPANVVLLRDAGNKLPKLKKKKKWAAVCSFPLEKGISKLAGIDVLPFEYPPIVTRDVYKHLYEGLNLTIEKSIKYIRSNIKKYDYFYIHIKETDIPGHDGLPKQKKKMLELIDKDFFAVLRRMNVRIVVTCDHTTACSRKRHTYHPVPLLIYDRKNMDNAERFTEQECRTGSIGRIKGKDLIKLLQK
ncbi:MAG: alkaline phosphatase family protein [archaeon]